MKLLLKYNFKLNIKDKDINKADIHSRLKEQNADENDVVLNRYTTRWEELPTSQIKTDARYFHYKATTVILIRGRRDRMLMKKNKKYYLVVIILITFLVYLNTFNNEFIWDDKDFILGWGEIRSFRNIPSLIKGNLPEHHLGVYRPARNVIYAFSFKLFGENPFGYHLQALLVHLSATILIFLIASILTNNHIGFLTSLLFGVHPIHTGAITYITSSFDQIGVVFFLLSLFFYLRASNDRINKKKYISSILFGLLAFFTYEITLTLPFIIILTDYFLKRVGKNNFIKRIKLYLPYICSAFVYIFIRFFLIKIVLRRSGYLANSFYHTMLAMSKVIVKEISLVILPLKLTVHHLIPRGIMSFGNTVENEKIILAQSIFDIEIVGSLFLIGILLAMTVFYRWKIISFCIAWFFITLLPVLNIIPIQTLLDEDFLYLPSFAFCFIISYFIYRIFKNENFRCAKIISIFLFASLFLFYSVKTVSRNNDWQDSMTFWLSTSRDSPFSLHAKYNLGEEYYKEGIEYLNNKENEKAIESFLKSVEYKPIHAGSYNNIGTIYYSYGNLNKALEYFQKAIDVDNRFIDAYNNIIIIFLNNNQPEKALDYSKKALKVAKNNPEFYYFSGFAYRMIGKYKEAEESLKKALEISPNYEAAQIELEKLYHK